MRVEVLLFARAREIGGAGRLDLEIDEGGTVADCFRAVARRSPAIEPLRDRLAVAVNESYAEWDSRLSSGDTVAFIPPVSGG